MAARSLGRYSSWDGRFVGVNSAGSTRRLVDNAEPVIEHANKRLVAIYPSEAFIAERDAGQLKVYMVGESLDLGVFDSAQADHRATLRSIGEMNRAFYSKRSA